MSSNALLYTKTVLPAVNTVDNITAKMYRGFSTVNSKTENYNLYDFELIKQDLLNHFYIRQGERLMNPTFGTIIWDLLFEPLTEQVKSLIEQNVTTIVNYDPRIKVESVNILQYNSGIQVECVLTFLPYNISQQMQIQFDQNNGLAIV